MSRKKDNGIICINQHQSGMQFGKGDTIEGAWNDYKDNTGEDDLDYVEFYRLGEEIKVELKLVQIETIQEVLPK